MQNKTSEDSQHFVAIPYSRKHNRYVKHLKKGSKYVVRIVERDTLEAKLYLKHNVRARIATKKPLGSQK